jgi:hypothetical protein
MRASIAITAAVVFSAVLALSVGSRLGAWGTAEGESFNNPVAIDPPEPSKRRDPRELLNRRDMAIARAAVIRQSNLEPPWREVPAPMSGDKGCDRLNYELSRFTVTGKARSMFKRRSALIESRVKVYANSGQASEVFRQTSGQPLLDCMREGVQEWLSDAGFSPDLIDEKVLTQPPIGEQTVIYTFGFWLQDQDRPNYRFEYPVETISFRMGRAIAALSFSYVAAKNDEVGLARVVAARLMQSARG